MMDVHPYVAFQSQPSMVPSYVVLERLLFTLAGIPQGKGSMVPGRTKDGRSFVRGDNPRTKGWQGSVGLAADLAMYNQRWPRCFEGPVVVGLTFVFVRPTSRKREYFSAVKPDADKLVRAILDGMTGIVYKDDSQVVGLTHVWKLYGPAPGVQIDVAAIHATALTRTLSEVFDEAAPVPDSVWGDPPVPRGGTE